MSNKTESFNYKGGCSVHGHTCIEAFKKEPTWAIDKWLQVIRCDNCCVEVNIVHCMVVNFCWDQIIVDFVRFLSIKCFVHGV